MIEKALDILKIKILEFLKQQPELSVQSEEKIQLQQIPSQDNNNSTPKDILCMSLVNIEEDRIFKSNKTKFADDSGKIVNINPDLKINLFILITSNFEKYSTSLSYLSAVIRFFQSTNVFTHSNTPGLDPSIEKLIVELYTLDFEQQNHLWGAMGTRYLPSVMYKVRMLQIQEKQSTSIQEPLQILDLVNKKV